jgi:tetratricopeptide (TPR) repeat protein
LVIQIRKEGYKDEEFYITDLEQVDLSITKRMSTIIAWKDATLLNKAIETLFEVRSLSEAKKYDEALALISNLKKDYPNLAAIYELEGGIHVLRGHYASALDSYTKAWDYNPQNGQLQETVRQLERMTGTAPRMQLKDLRVPTATTTPDGVTVEPKEGDKK